MSYFIQNKNVVTKGGKTSPAKNKIRRKGLKIKTPKNLGY